jgi:FAD/FMN-containing dehydrogenase
VAGLSRRELLARGSRGVLLLAGAGELAALAGCSGRSGGNDLRDLAGKVSGPIVVPGDHRYAQAKLLFNPAVDRSRPRAIVVCRTPEDVAETVAFGRRHGIRVAARSGGHSFGGYSAPDGGIVADLSSMRRIDVAPDHRTASVEPGVLNVDLDSALPEAGLAVPSGTCGTVGLGGLTLGGGFGYSSRALGLTIDNLLELDVVLASGERATCSRERHPDLFWACRGGGGGNFGIVTAFRFHVHPVRDVSVYSLTWRWKDAAAVVDAWQRWAPDAPDELFSTCNLSRSGGASPEGPTVASAGQYFGSPAQLAALLEPLVSAAQPVQRQVTRRSFRAAQELWAGCAPCAPRAANPYRVKSAFFNDAIPAAGIQTMLEEIDRWPGSLADAPTVGVELNSWGGAIARVPASATAFVHRDARFLAIFGTTWSPHDSAAHVAANQAWQENLYARMSRYASGYAYQNLIDPRLADWEHAYYGANYPRLQRIKRTYDPEDFFRFRQSIRPAR